MKIITQLVILTLSLLLVNGDQYCDNFLKQYATFRNKCSLQSLTITSCCDLRIVSTVSGVYKLNKGTFNSADVYCDMNTTTGGWIVIQRNKNGSLLNFNKNWNDYEKGFGELNTEFWYGLESIHCLTQRGQWEMRVDFQRNERLGPMYLHYNHFSVGSASEEYSLTVGGYSGSIPSDHVLYYNGIKFSTFDNDNDQWGGNCAARDKSGNWHLKCRHVNLNQQPPYVNPPGSILFTEMKIHPKDCIIQ